MNFQKWDALPNRRKKKVKLYLRTPGDRYVRAWWLMTPGQAERFARKLLRIARAVGDN
jgi:hypothetical protein